MLEITNMQLAVQPPLVHDYRECKRPSYKVTVRAPGICPEDNNNINPALMFKLINRRDGLDDENEEQVPGSKPLLLPRLCITRQGPEEAVEELVTLS